ncbi:hypothetical protein E4U28_006656, partial [Claviceps purpurea]
KPSTPGNDSGEVPQLFRSSSGMVQDSRLRSVVNTQWTQARSAYSNRPRELTNFQEDDDPFTGGRRNAGDKLSLERLHGSAVVPYSADPLPPRVPPRVHPPRRRTLNSQTDDPSPILEYEEEKAIDQHSAELQRRARRDRDSGS